MFSVYFLQLLWFYFFYIFHPIKFYIYSVRQHLSQMFTFVYKWLAVFQTLLLHNLFFLKCHIYNEMPHYNVANTHVYFWTTYFYSIDLSANYYINATFL